MAVAEKRDQSVQARLSDRVMANLRALAIASGKDPGQLASEIITRSVMGDVYALRLAARHLSRATSSDDLRDSE